MEKRFRPPITLLIIATVLLIIGLVYVSQMENIPGLQEALQDNLFLNAVPFLAIFIAILLYYIALIATIQRAFSGRISQKVYRPMFTATVVGIVAGIFMMFQPWALIIYKIGFNVLLVSLLLFMIVSHVTPKPLSLDEMG